MTRMLFLSHAAHLDSSLLMMCLQTPWPHMFQAVDVGEQIGIFGREQSRLGASCQVL